MTTVVVSSGCFHTKTSITSSGPRRYSGIAGLAAYVGLRLSAAPAAKGILAKTKSAVSAVIRCIVRPTQPSLCLLRNLGPRVLRREYWRYALTLAIRLYVICSQLLTV